MTVWHNNYIPQGETLFAWAGMKEDIKTYVSSCQVCSQAKLEHYKLPGLLQPLEVPP